MLRARTRNFVQHCIQGHFVIEFDQTIHFYWWRNARSILCLAVCLRIYRSQLWRTPWWTLQNIFLLHIHFTSWHVGRLGHLLGGTRDRTKAQASAKLEPRRAALRFPKFSKRARNRPFCCWPVQCAHSGAPKAHDLPSCWQSQRALARSLPSVGWLISSQHTQSGCWL